MSEHATPDRAAKRMSGPWGFRYTGEFPLSVLRDDESVRADGAGGIVITDGRGREFRYGMGDTVQFDGSGNLA